MNIIEVNDYAELSEKGAQFMINMVRKNPTIRLGLATGETPIGTYQKLIEDHQQNGTSFQNVTTFNLDEYVGLSGENKNSYRYFMNNKLFHHIDININHTHLPQGDAKDIQFECQHYENLISLHGGIDLQLLGIGRNGHIGFNEPGTSFESKTQVIQLASSTIKANARFFNTIDEVPTRAITLGISNIMKSKQILLLVSGESKRQAMDELLNGEVTERFPASILKKHPCVTIIADKAAVSSVLAHS